MGVASPQVLSHMLRWGLIVRVPQSLTLQQQHQQQQHQRQQIHQQHTVKFR